MDATTWIALVSGIVGGSGISGLGGYILAGRNERNRDERAAEREREALGDKQADEARTFQRDTLLELHDLLYKMNRNAGKSIFADSQRHKETGRYGRDPLPDDLSEQSTELIAAINRLRVRVFDPELRDSVQRYKEMVIRAMDPLLGSRHDGDDDRVRQLARQEMDAAMLTWLQLEDRIGAAIRAQFPGSDVAQLGGLVPGQRPPSSANGRRPAASSVQDS
jgi:hypothetical protein